MPSAQVRGFCSRRETQDNRALLHPDAHAGDATLAVAALGCVHREQTGTAAGSLQDHQRDSEKESGRRCRSGSAARLRQEVLALASPRSDQRLYGLARLVRDYERLGTSSLDCLRLDLSRSTHRQESPLELSRTTRRRVRECRAREAPAGG